MRNPAGHQSRFAEVMRKKEERAEKERRAMVGRPFGSQAE